MITSVSNSRVKRVAALNTRARMRKQEGQYVVEGVRMFLEAPGEEIQEAFVAESFSHERCMEKLDAMPWERVSDEVFRKMSATETPQGILCVMRMKHHYLEEMLKRENPLIMVLEDIQDPGNLGTILRTAEGAGIDGVIASRESADLYNPKTIRSTMGSIYRMPFVYVPSLQEAADRLKAEGIRLYAADLSGEKWYDGEDYTGGSALLIGNEGNGLRPETAALADARIRIPMAGRVESLNAAMASGILMYEASRQRRSAGGAFL